MQQPIPFNRQGPQGRNYTYTTSVQTLAAAGSATSTLNIRAYADFIIYKMCMFADIAGAAQTDGTRVLPLVTLQITDTGAGDQLFSAPTPIPMLFGYGSLPFILPGARRIDAASTLQFSWYNYDAASTYANIYLSLIGVEVPKK